MSSHRHRSVVMPAAPAAPPAPPAPIMPAPGEDLLDDANKPGTYYGLRDARDLDSEEPQ